MWNLSNINEPYFIDTINNALFASENELEIEELDKLGAETSIDGVTSSNIKKFKCLTDDGAVFFYIDVNAPIEELGNGYFKTKDVHGKDIELLVASTGELASLESLHLGDVHLKAVDVSHSTLALDSIEFVEDFRTPQTLELRFLNFVFNQSYYGLSCLDDKTGRLLVLLNKSLHKMMMFKPEIFDNLDYLSSIKLKISNALGVESIQTKNGFFEAKLN